MAAENTKDGLQALKQAIKNNRPESLYIFHGEETFLLNHYLEQLRRSLLDEITESFNYHKFNSENFDIQQFGDAVENFPMMSEHTLVLVEDIDIFKLSEEMRDYFCRILSDIPSYCTLVFSYLSIPWKPDKRQKKLWDVISSAQIVDFAKQNQRDLVSWITRHFASHKKQINPDLCLYLISLTDGTMTSIASEIRKIAAYSGADVICKADIDAVTEPVLDAVVFQMTDQLAASDYSAALNTLQKLMKMQQEPIAILGAIGGHFRRIGVARTLLDHGKTASELQKLCSISEYPARKSMEAARRFSAAYCAKANELILDTDYRMKTSFDSAPRLLEMLVLQLAQEARNG